MIWTDGGFFPVSTARGDAVVVDIFVLDASSAGTVILGQHRYIATNGAFVGNANWSFSLAPPLVAGAHTISVGAFLSGNATSAGQLANAVVGAAATELNRGALNTLHINK